MQLRPVKINMSGMMELVRKFTKPGEVVPDCFAGTCAVYKAFLLLPKHLVLVGCDMDGDFLRVLWKVLLKCTPYSYLTPNMILRGVRPHCLLQFCFF